MASRLVLLLWAAAAVLAVTAQNLPAYCGVDPSDPGESVIPPLQPPPQAQGLKLVQSIVIIRHGDRFQATAGQCYPDDNTQFNCTLLEDSYPDIITTGNSLPLGRVYRKKYYSESNGNCAIGALTQKGYSQQMVHGTQLRQAYVEDNMLLSPTPVTEEYLIHADDVPRTIASAEALFLGLYPPLTNLTNGVQIIDLYTEAIEETFIYPNDNLCPMIDTLANEATASPAYMAYMNQTVAPLTAKVASELGESNPDLGFLFDCLHVQVCHDQKIPLDAATFSELTDAATWITVYPYTYPNATLAGAVGMGPFFADMWNHMQAMMQNVSTAKKMVIYSGHDSTLMPFLAAFNRLGVNWSPYASLASVELYSHISNPSQFSVRLVYNGGEIILPGCNGSVCDMQTFQPLIESLLPTQAECPGYFAKLRRERRKLHFKLSGL